mmetsp:Transcript_28227/g.66807  ORF Transcript_28227/g.66807 Transcript_28227/m.66807 type:complete len:582 (+) Transcript_28227:104-1849(+)
MPEGRKEGREKDDALSSPAQVFSRDLSLLVLSAFGPLRAADLEERRKKREQRAQEAGRPAREFRPLGLKIFEAFAASGIKSIRYAKELPQGAEGVRLLVANGPDESCAARIRESAARGGVPEGRIQAASEDANGHMYARRARGAGGLGDDAYDVIDLDASGTAAPFLDAAVQAVADGGLLCITSTDLPILNGNNPETCFARYGGTALKCAYAHELALRLVLHAVAAAAAKCGREAKPLLACSMDLCIRLFVHVTDSAARAKHHASRTALVHQCVQCESFFLQPLGEVAAPGEDAKESQRFKTARVVAPGAECPECNGRLKLGGPFHSGPLFDRDFVKLCLEACKESACAKLPGVTSWKRITDLLTAISEEHADLALFYKLPQLCRGLKLAPVPLKQFRGTLRDLGYRVSHFHREPEAVKTDAPNAVVYDLLRIWAEEHPPKSCPLPELLRKELTLKRPIAWHSEEEAPKGKAARVQSSPEASSASKSQARGGAAPAPPSAGAAGAGIEAPAATEPAATATPAGEAASVPAVAAVASAAAAAVSAAAAPEQGSGGSAAAAPARGASAAAVAPAGVAGTEGAG